VDEKQLATISSEWRKVAPRLLGFVKSKIGLGLLPKGHDAEDVVQMAFERIIAGSRSWNPEKVNLETHMKRSILRSMLGSKGLPAVKDTDAGEFTDDEDFEHLNSEGVSVRDVPQDPIPEIDRTMAFTMLEDEIQGDKELADILAAIRMGCQKPADIAEMTGIPVKRVYGLKPKLADYANKVRLKLSDNHGEGA